MLRTKDETPSVSVNPCKLCSPGLVVSNDKLCKTTNPPKKEKRLIVSQATTIDIQSTHLGNGDIFDHLLVHIDEGAGFGVAIEDTERGYEVYGLGGDWDRSPGNDRGFGGHGEIVMQEGGVGTAEVFCGKLGNSLELSAILIYPTSQMIT